MTDLQKSCRTHRDEFFVALQRLLPQHLASRWLGKLADSTTPWLKNRLIHLAMDHYDIDLREAELESPSDYPSFNAFFTRKLKAAARPIDGHSHSIVSAADGTISQIGDITEGQLIQAKGRLFSVTALLGCAEDIAEKFAQGSFTTIYLSPRDYHRVHMPMDGELVAANYIPGKLFSVNDATARQVDGLFARNERLVCHFETEYGKLAVVLVGALFVAGIETQWQQEFVPGHCQTVRFDKPLRFAKGDELGLFKFGSTVIVLTEAPVAWQETQFPGSGCKMGREMGTIKP